MNIRTRMLNSSFAYQANVELDREGFLQTSNSCPEEYTSGAFLHFSPLLPIQPATIIGQPDVKVYNPLTSHNSK